MDAWCWEEAQDLDMGFTSRGNARQVGQDTRQIGAAYSPEHTGWEIYPSRYHRSAVWWVFNAASLVILAGLVCWAIILL